MVPENLKYTKEHEWIKKDGDLVTIGISEYAQEELGDIVFVELPAEGDLLSKGDSPITLESVKAVSSVYAPFSGNVVKVNNSLEDEPELINSSPYEDGWLFQMQVTDDDNQDLMDSGEYQKYIDTLD